MKRIHLKLDYTNLKLPQHNIVLPFKDCCGEIILPKGWKLNEAGKKPTFLGNGLAEVEKDDSKNRILLHVITMLTKLTCALKVTFCDESRSY